MNTTKPRRVRFTASDLKRAIEANGHESFFFDRGSMKFFGDTMKNYGVTSKPVMVETVSHGTVECWELYRIRPVKHGLQSSAYFDCKDFKRVFPIK